MTTPSPNQLRYFANVRLPSERANSIQIVNMCSAFAGCGWEVELLHPRRYNRFKTGAASIHEHYNVPDRFGVKKIFSLDFIDRLPRALQHPAFRLQSITFALRAVAEMSKKPAALSYIRDNATLAVAAALLPAEARRRLFYEAHDFPDHPRSAKALVRAARKCGGVVAITRGLARRFQEAGLAKDRLHIAPDGVDLGRFDSLPDRDEARDALSLPRDRALVVYTGQLFPWKGVDTLVESAVHLPEADLLIVGGREEDRRSLQKNPACAAAMDRIRFQDQVLPDQVPLYLRAADVLVLPNSGNYTISRHYTSPMKLFEYMAAGRPMVASDLPSLGEVLTHEENALLVPPDDPQALARAVIRLLTDSSLKDRLVARASEDVASFGWDGRAAGILEFMKTQAEGESP